MSVRFSSKCCDARAGRPVNRRFCWYTGSTTSIPDAPFLDSLAKHGEIVAPSHPGFGHSPRPEDFDTMYDLVHLYLAILDDLPDEKITMIGFSFGGWIAAEVAVCRPHKLARLVLVDPVGIKVGGREERDIVHFFNTSPDELNRRAWHDPAKQPARQLRAWLAHGDRRGDER